MPARWCYPPGLDSFDARANISPEKADRMPKTDSKTTVPTPDPDFVAGAHLAFPKDAAVKPGRPLDVSSAGIRGSFIRMPTR
jgi:hypothetical protein